MENKLAVMLDSAIAQEHRQKPKRSYLGASRLGENCARKLQYEFMGAEPDQPFSGKQLRTFAMGHHLESLVISWLKDAGFDIRTHNKDGQQYSFSVANDRIAGHIDGVIVAGPDGFLYPALFECKTLNNKSCKTLKNMVLQLVSQGTTYRFSFTWPICSLQKHQHYWLLSIKIPRSFISSGWLLMGLLPKNTLIGLCKYYKHQALLSYCRV